MKKDFLKAVVVLGLIALFSGALLGLLYQVTYISADEQEKRAIETLKTVYYCENYETLDFESPDADLNSNIQFFFYDSTADVYAIVATGIKGYGDVVPMYVIIKDDKIIALAHGDIKETPGVSDTAFSQSYLDKFLVSVDTFDEADVQTGATAKHSAAAVISSVQNAVNFYIAYRDSLKG